MVIQHRHFTGVGQSSCQTSGDPSCPIHDHHPPWGTSSCYTGPLGKAGDGGACYAAGPVGSLALDMPASYPGSDSYPMRASEIKKVNDKGL